MTMNEQIAKVGVAYAAALIILAGVLIVLN